MKTQASLQCVTSNQCKEELHRSWLLSAEHLNCDAQKPTAVRDVTCAPALHPGCINTPLHKGHGVSIHKMGLVDPKDRKNGCGHVKRMRSSQEEIRPMAWGKQGWFTTEQNLQARVESVEDQRRIGA